MKVTCTKCSWTGDIPESDDEQKCPTCGSAELIEVDTLGDEPGDDYMGEE